MKRLTESSSPPNKHQCQWQQSVWTRPRQLSHQRTNPRSQQCPGEVANGDADLQEETAEDVVVVVEAKPQVKASKVRQGPGDKDTPQIHQIVAVTAIIVMETLLGTVSHP